MKTASAIFVFAACLGAAACSKAEAPVAADKAGPIRAAGQWREIHTIDGKRAPNVDRCVAAEDLIQVYRLAPGPGEDCSTFDVALEGKTLNVATVCQRGGSTITETTKATGDFETRFTVETVTTMNPVPDSFGAKARSTYLITAERTGDC